MRIAVVGAGSWGTTVASLAAERHDTTLWAREPEVVDAVTERAENTMFLPDVALPPSLRATGDLDVAVADADVVVMAVPAQHLRGVAERLAPLLDARRVVVSLAKGIERGTLRRPSEVLRDVLDGVPEARIGVLSGPNLAREVSAGQPSATVVAMADHDAARDVQGALLSDRFRVYTSTDVVGCEIGGAVKNVIAIAAGAADGLGFGWNARAALITRGLAELTRLGVALGGDPLTFLGLAGNGDLIATCSSPQSRNRRFGVELGNGRTTDEILGEMKMVAEGVASAPAVLELAAGVGVEMPIATEVAAMLRGEKSPADVVAALMRRGATSELHDLPAPAPGRG
ncbi:MAG: NAD(P)H-dependent glycerol-3-phosphate dehydrogenase [Acidimicrobiales bacterium]